MMLKLSNILDAMETYKELNVSLRSKNSQRAICGL